MSVFAFVKLVPGYDEIGHAFASTSLADMDDEIKYSQWPAMYTLRGAYFTKVDGLPSEDSYITGIELPWAYLVPMEIALNSWIFDNYKKRLNREETLKQWLEHDYKPTLFISAGD